MNTKIYCFSGTGNSLFMAKSLARELGVPEVVSIGNIAGGAPIAPDATQVIIVFPVYYCGLPLIVEKFIERLQVPASAKIIFINTSGDDNGMDCSTHKITRLLSAKNAAVAGGYNIQMPGNYTKMYDMESDASISDKMASSDARLKQIADMIRSGTNTLKKDRFSFLGRLVNDYWQKRVAGSDRVYEVGPSCNGCGICEKVCPVDNIALAGGKPEWRHACEDCLACLHYCPKNAINTKKSAGRPQYHHPSIAASEMIAAKQNG